LKFALDTRTKKITLIGIPAIALSEQPTRRMS